MMIQDNISIIVGKKVHLQSMYRVEEIHNFFKTSMDDICVS